MDSSRSEPGFSTPGVQDQTILITGGAGFIGSHLADTLAPDNHVTVLDNLTADTRSNVPDGVSFLEADIRDDAALESVTRDTDIIFHQAGLVSVPSSV